MNPIFVFILGMSNARYLGIPRDGFSYDEVMNKYNEQKNHVQYQNPTQGQYNQYGYQAPNTPNHTAPNQNTTNAGTNPEGNVQPNQTSQNQNTTGQSSAPADSYDDTHNSFN